MEQYRTSEESLALKYQVRSFIIMFAYLESPIVPRKAQKTARRFTNTHECTIMYQNVSERVRVTTSLYDDSTTTTNGIKLHLSSRTRSRMFWKNEGRLSYRSSSDRQWSSINVAVVACKRMINGWRKIR